MTDECLGEWEDLFNQCMYLTEDPYYWTEDCDMVEMFLEAWMIWYDGIEDE
jgi:hypothetical protein